MARPPRTKRRRRALIAGSILLLLLVLAGSFAAYTTYRVNRFAEGAFRPEATAPRTQFGAPTSTAIPPTPTATLTPTPAGTAVPAALDTPTPEPTATPVATPTPTPLPYGNSPVIARLKAGERVTVLLLGFGGPGHDGGYLTDSLQVISFDPRSGVATLISLPRDLLVYIPRFEGRGGYWGKINEAYSVGTGNIDRNEQRVPYRTHEKGGTVAAMVVAEILDLPIDYWVSLDFVGFRQFIDALGGVDVDVERAFTDTQYPNNDDATVDPSYRIVHFDCGRQRLNGQRAMEFARSRYAPEDGSDFGRARRQQLLLAAVKDELFSVETLPKVFDLLGAVDGHFFTSFSFQEALDLAGWTQERARNKRPITVQSVVVDTGLLYSTYTRGGAYVLVPRLGEGEYGAIQRVVHEAIGGEDGAARNRAGTPQAATPGRAGSSAGIVASPPPTEPTDQTPSPAATWTPEAEGTPGASNCGGR